MLTVTEAGLYRLIFKSRKPVAKRFQRWVFHDVLPAIRQAGSYSALEEQPAALALLQSPLMAEIAALKHKGKALAAEIQIHEKAVISHQQSIERLQQELDNTELRIADANLSYMTQFTRSLNTTKTSD